VVGRVVGRADDELRALGRRESLQRLVVDRDDAARLGQQRDAGLGQPRPAAVRFDQRPAQRLLQAADVLAHRGLAELQVRRGAVEAAGVSHGDQAAQRNDVEHA
jgi:hypothetical protein